MTNKVKNWWLPPTLHISEENKIERHATWLELFYDLIFVVVIAKIAQNPNQDISLSGFLGFVMLFIPIWWSWVSSTLYSTRFDTDDPLHRFLTGIQMFCIANLAINVHDGSGALMMILSIVGANFSPIQLIGVIAVICVMQIILELNYAITSS